MSDELSTAAMVVAKNLQNATSACRERGDHPRMTPMSLQDGFDLAVVLGKCVAELAELQAKAAD